MKLNDFSTFNRSRAKEELFKCCGSTTWVNKLMTHFPFASIDQLKKLSDGAWKNCSKEDWLEAFSHHPKIGEKGGDKHLDTKGWASQEQSGVDAADESIKLNLAELNQLYEEKFGFIFIVCATGKTASQMLAILNERINNDPEKEIRVAASEQNKITHLRIDKLFS